jgi:hypothetical protein
MARKLLTTALWLMFALAASSCARGGLVQCPEPPKLPAPPASLMTPPTFEQRLRHELYESEPRLTPTSERAKQP